MTKKIEDLTDDSQVVGYTIVEFDGDRLTRSFGTQTGRLFRTTEAAERVAQRLSRVTVGSFDYVVTPVQDAYLYDTKA